MRYYSIEITNPTTGQAYLPTSLGGLPLSSLNADGSFNPSALNIELDIPVSAMAAPDASVQALCRVWGLGIRDLGSAYNLAPSIATDSTPARQGASIKIFGGMSKGLPLANPKQQGPLVVGSVLNAYGNVVLTDMTMDLILGPPVGGPDAPLNLVLNWTAGQKMSDAIMAALKIAFPKIPIRVNISPNLILNHDKWGTFTSLDEFAEIVEDLSMSIINRPDYPGVSVVNNGSNITVTDFTTKPAPKMIAFQDLIGQPTWGGQPGTVQAKFVMRGDLAIGDIITLPPSLQTTTAAAQLNFFDRSLFSGNFRITDLHHYGNFRQADASSWNTTVNMAVEPNDSPTASATPGTGQGAP